jgi:hypothetical protein
MLAERLDGAVEAGSRLEVAWRLARVLSIKTHLHLTLRSAYRAGDIAELTRLASVDIPALLIRVQELFAVHQARWEVDNKVFGWETIERRYGGLLLRLQSLEKKLRLHLADPQTIIEELTLDVHDVYSPQELPHIVINHRKATAPSAIN